MSRYIESSASEPPALCSFTEKVQTVVKDIPFETPLRPQSLHEFVGQDSLRERLQLLIAAAKLRKEPAPHCLFGGPPGLGKTTLANIVAKSMQSNLVVTSGPALEKAGDLAGLLTNLQEGDILFIDEIHRLSRTLEEYLYPAMEDFSLDLMLDSGPSARSVKLQLKPFTLVGATTRLGALTDPLRSRFGLTLRLEYYPADILAKVVMRTSALLNIPLDQPSALAIAKRARGTPRIANHLVRWVRDYSQIRANHQINQEIVGQALDMLAIDLAGLDELDKKFLHILIDHYQGGPVGLNTLAVALSEAPETIEEVLEPYLIQEGYIQRTPRGRQATEKAYKHMGCISHTFGDAPL